MLITSTALYYNAVFNQLYLSLSLHSVKMWYSTYCINHFLSSLSPWSIPPTELITFTAVYHCAIVHLLYKINHFHCSLSPWSIPTNCINHYHCTMSPCSTRPTLLITFNAVCHHAICHLLCSVTMQYSTFCINHYHFPLSLCSTPSTLLITFTALCLHAVLHLLN